VPSTLSSIKKPTETALHSSLPSDGVPKGLQIVTLPDLDSALRAPGIENSKAPSG
jgi:hypothetical protein